MKHSSIIVVSIVLILGGGMVMDPMAGLLCFALSGILALLPVIRAKGNIRYVAVFVLLASIALALSKAPDAIKHYERYIN